MIFEGKYELRSSRERLWEFLNDPTKISRCLPDLKALEVESEDKFNAVIHVGVGFIRTDFKFKIEILERNPVTHLRLKAVGGGSGSSITIDLGIELNEFSGGSELFYRSDIKVGGIVASLGQRVINDTAGKTLAEVFECIRRQVE
jgi:carbon monoxide dehydrogenase subunit G